MKKEFFLYFFLADVTKSARHLCWCVRNLCKIVQYLVLEKPIISIKFLDSLWIAEFSFKISLAFNKEVFNNSLYFSLIGYGKNELQGILN